MRLSKKLQKIQEVKKQLGQSFEIIRSTHEQTFDHIVGISIISEYDLKQFIIISNKFLNELKNAQEAHNLQSDTFVAGLYVKTCFYQSDLYLLYNPQQSLSYIQKIPKRFLANSVLLKMQYIVNLSEIYNICGKYHDSINCIEEFIEENITQNIDEAGKLILSYIYYHLAYAYESLGNIDKAINIYKEALSYRSTDIETYTKIAILSLKKLDFEEYNKVIIPNMKNGKNNLFFQYALTLRSYLLYNNKIIDMLSNKFEDNQLYKTVSSLDKEYVYRIYGNTTEWLKVIDIMAKNEEFSHNVTKHFIQYSVIKVYYDIAVGNELDGLVRLNDILNQYSDHFIVMLCNLEVLAAIKRYEEAITYAEAHINIFSQHPYAMQIIGSSHTALGQFDKAYECLKPIYDKYNKYLNIRYNIGNLCFAQNKYDEALKYYEAAAPEETLYYYKLLHNQAVCHVKLAGKSDNQQKIKHLQKAASLLEKAIEHEKKQDKLGHSFQSKLQGILDKVYQLLHKQKYYFALVKELATNQKIINMSNIQPQETAFAITEIRKTSTNDIVDIGSGKANEMDKQFEHEEITEELEIIEKELKDKISEKAYKMHIYENETSLGKVVREAKYIWGSQYPAVDDPRMHIVKLNDGNCMYVFLDREAASFIKEIDASIREEVFDKFERAIDNGIVAAKQKQGLKLKDNICKAKILGRRGDLRAYTDEVIRPINHSDDRILRCLNKFGKH